MAPDERDPARPVIPADRTMQLDALTDVELSENVSEDDDSEEERPGDDAPSGSGAAPPPLPRRQRAPSRAVQYAIAIVVIVVMAGLGAGLAHLLVGGAPVAAPAAEAPAPTTIAAPPAREPRRVELGEIVIGGSTEAPPAGEPGASDPPPR